MRVKLQFESPLIIGEKKLSSNYIASKDYIQGSVIRAAFARAILDQCDAYHGEVEQIKVKDSEGKEQIISKKNWVHCRGEEETYREKYGVICNQCPYHTICAKFSEIKFSFFYPEDTSIIPLTSMCCKSKPEKHGFIDSLTQDRVCPVCNKIDPQKARVEFESGLRNAKGKYKAEKVVQTKTAIDPYTRTAKDGMLYNLVSLSPINFQGEIEGIDKNELELFETLRVGAYISTGFGKCRVLEDTHYEEKEPTIDRVYEYSRKYREHQKSIEHQEDNKEYLVLMLTSDAHVQVEVPEEYCSTEEYISRWEKCIGLGVGKLHKVYFDTVIYRGYDTSSVSDDYRAKVKYQINKGGMMVYEFDNKEQLKMVYDKYCFGANGKNKVKFTIGNECENGYGSCQIYCGEVKNNGK